jgi:chromosome segregation ATPase
MASYSNRSALENRQHSVPASVGAHIYQLEAQHAKEMRNLQAKHHQARQLLQKNAAKLESYSKEVHRLRSIVESQKKENVAGRRLVEHAVLEKKQLESQAKSNREYAKKIEHKLAMGAKGRFLAEQNGELKKQLAEESERAAQQGAVISAQDGELEKAAAEIAVLSRALETRVETMGQHAADGGGDGGGAGGVACELGMPPDGNVRNSVLYQLAERKQENHALSLDLAAAQAKLRDLDAEIGAAQLGLGAAQREKDAAASACDGLGEELRAARAERETQQAEAAELTGERSVMLEYIQELAEKVAALEADLGAERGAASAAAEAAAAQLGAANTREADLREAAEQAAGRTEHLTAAARTLETVLAKERDTVGALRAQVAALEGAKAAAERRAEAVELALAEGAGRAAAAGAAAADARGAQAAAAAQSESAGREVASLRAELHERESNETALRGELEAALADLQRATAQREEAVSAMNEAVAISAQSLVEQQALESKSQAHASQIGSLQESKSLLQKAMLERLSSARQQLRVEQERRQRAEDELGALRTGGSGGVASGKTLPLRSPARSSPARSAVASFASSPASAPAPPNLLDLAR